MRKNVVSKSISKARVWCGICVNKVLQGPYQVYVNVTDLCNLNCLMCPVYSPLVNTGDQPRPRSYLRRDILERLVDSLTLLKVQLVTITGGGEPFLHPFLMEFIRRLSSTNKDVTVVTNGTVMREDQIPELLRLNVNLRFSLIAASHETYVNVHPNQTAATFQKLQKTLSLINNLRKHYPSNSVISILFVIFKNNFHEIPRMLDMGEEYQVDFVHFKPAIFAHEQMKKLFLDDVQLLKLQDIIGSVKSSHDISCTDLSTMCGDLEENQERIVSTSESGLKRSTPCYKGWTFCWILANGNVVPCCDCSVSLGNINDKPFEQIWYSPRYSDLRKSMTELRQGVISLPGCRCDTCRPDSEDIKISKGLRLIGRSPGRKKS